MIFNCEFVLLTMDAYSAGCDGASSTDSASSVVTTECLSSSLCSLPRQDKYLGPWVLLFVVVVAVVLNSFRRKDL